MKVVGVRVALGQGADDTRPRGAVTLLADLVIFGRGREAGQLPGFPFFAPFAIR